ncbi:hypothetical protein N7522_000297 [Penicillium canescens]|uniref:Uncharacterized protein n=1 Tax=Penicillium canescens TaxID=5083 RepID=A0AAD6N802_PENCN|nr:uncharacterized protein N7446_012346 [Penicillium canescens]XP_058366546.1 uncharacterized protein N7446_012438 [Penicillium canescens]KAJ6020126.1 hypothetical protein N7522_000201 [Penicillium canescens]KAJ6020222.1 hypothetical protein N7522_000297 [Penicillium canescens]KAJ6038072.1 hypothetical protein N7460_007843 [Penicillium canescens]KAJ6038176.1 hypothetical protein N7460_007947 [Penicillium canescens]KAJ6045482.1 hypothetical protein N7446_012346 [Penicillium canescens]
MTADSTPNVELHTPNDVLENPISPSYAVGTEIIAVPEPIPESRSMKEGFTAKPDRDNSSADIPTMRPRRGRCKRKRGRGRRNRSQQLREDKERLIAQHTLDEIKIQHLKREIKARWLQHAEFLARRLHSRARSI